MYKRQVLVFARENEVVVRYRRLSRVNRPAARNLVERVNGEWRGAIGGRQQVCICLLYTSPSPRDRTRSRMPSSA